MGRLPLKDITIVDLSWVIAGPLATQMLNNLGANVIRIESSSKFDIVRPDSCRDKDSDYLKEGGWLYQQINYGKTNVSLNLKSEKGREAFEGLVKRADIVVCNYSTSAFKKLKLTYEDLSQINPSIIVLNASGMGYTGPYSNYVMFAPPLQAISGIASCVGYAEDSVPFEEYLPLTDYIGSLTIANLLMAAVEDRRRTGKGQFIDLSQCEGAVSFLGPLILDRQVNGCDHNLIGNHHYTNTAAPHNAYRCKDEKWCVIAVAAEDEWYNFCKTVDPNGEWCTDEKFRTIENRIKNQDELDRNVTAWTMRHTPEEVGEILQSNNVSAAPVQTRMDFLYKDKHIKDRKFLAKVDLPITERTPETFLVQQPIVHFPEYPMPEILPSAHAVGQDTDQVLKEMLGKSDEWLRQAHIDGAI